MAFQCWGAVWAPPLVWAGVCWVSWEPQSTCGSRPSLPSQLPYHYLLAHTALHRASSATVSQTFIIFITPPDSTDLNTRIHHSQSSCTTYYLSPQVHWAQFVALLDCSWDDWMPSDFSIKKASEFESNTPRFKNEEILQRYDWTTDSILNKSLFWKCPTHVVPLSLNSQNWAVWHIYRVS